MEVMELMVVVMLLCSSRLICWCIFWMHFLVIRVDMFVNYVYVPSALMKTELISKQVLKF